MKNMSEMELNKEGLFHLAKKFAHQNNSLPKSMEINTNQIKSKSFLDTIYKTEINNSPKMDFIGEVSEENKKRRIKKGIRFKNKFLEKVNIHINEEKMLDILSEKKNKNKIGLSQKNEKFKKNLRKAKIIKINLDEKNDMDNTQTNSINVDEYNKYKKILCDSNIKYRKNNDYNKFKNRQDPPYRNKIEGNKRIYVSNSEYFGNSINKYLMSERKNMKNIPNNYNLIKLKDGFNSNYNKKIINYGRNINKNLNNSLNNYFLYKKKDIEFDNNNNINEEINYKTVENENNEKNEYIKNNNNININININNNINNEDKINKVNKNNNSKIVRNDHKTFNNILQPDKFISYSKNYSKFNQDYNDDDFSNKNNINKIGDSPKKIIEKFVSRKIYYLKNKHQFFDKNKLDNEDNEDEDIKKEIDKNIKDENQTEISMENNYRSSFKNKNHNTYNINVNFISNQNNNISNTGYFNNVRYSNSGDLKQKRRTMTILSPKKEIVDIKRANYYRKIERNKTVYRAAYTEKLNKRKTLETDNKYNNSISSITNSIRQKYYKNNNNYTYSPNRLSNTNNYTYISRNDIINNKKDIIQLEDLLIIESKFCNLLECLKYEKIIPKMCIEWWNFYNYSSFFGKFPKLFPKISKNEICTNNDTISHYRIAHNSIMFELLSMIITFQILNQQKMEQNLINELNNLINEVHQNFLIECDYILSKLNNNSLNNIWIKKLKQLILSKKNWTNNNSESNNYHLYLLKENNKIIQNHIKNLLEIYSNSYKNNVSINSLIYYNNNISNIHLIELRGYFNKIINQEKMKINKTFSFIIKKKSDNQSNNINIEVPYLSQEIEGEKIFTLVLDLDETLISFRLNEKKHGILKIRPGLNLFLSNVGAKYELIIFTAGTQEYADPILDIIERKGKIFAKRLYRQHTSLINNIYIKDLTRLGRDLSKIIIVDNMPQNFCLQKENGILIKNYFGQDKRDNVLKNLSNILIKIASNPYNDVRKELKKYKEEIFTKITTNFSN